MRQTILPTLALAATLALPGGAARADLMTACAAEVSAFCSDVDRGRGRIVACLAGHVGELGAGCRPEVQAAGRSPLVPRGVRKIFDPGFRADLPLVCGAEAAALCPRVTPGDGQIFACLYARTDRVSPACADAVQSTLKGAN